MSKALKNSEHYIQLLAKSGPKRRKALLNQVTHEELKGLCEICLNILKGNIPLSDNFRKLKRNSNMIKVLASSKIPLRVKKRVVSQKGGFLGTVASLAIPLLSKLLLK